MSFSKNKGRQLHDLYKRLPADVRGHCVRVSVYMQTLLKQIMLTSPELCQNSVCRSEDEILELGREGGFYHDIGKILIPQDILNKRGQLNAAERAEMSRHPIYTSVLLNPILQNSRAYDRAFLEAIIQIGQSHHERWDGTGYPVGLCGEDIPFYARVCSICDAYDAMLSRRAYSPSYSDAHAMNEIVSGAGSQFDPALAEIFSKCNFDFSDF